MRFSIDVVFCDEDGQVLKLRENLRPWTISGYCRGAEFVVELPSNTVSARDLRVGDRLVIETRHHSKSS
jgi:uncharacterized membrane protein (UPF0127 family)